MALHLEKQLLFVSSGIIPQLPQISGFIANETINRQYGSYHHDPVRQKHYWSPSLMLSKS